MTRLRLLCACLVIALAPLAHAALTKQEIVRAGFDRQIGRTIPRDLVWHEADGRARTLGDLLGAKPALMMFVDYTCTTLCGVTVNQLAETLKSVSYEPGTDYRVLVIGFNPADGPREAARFRDERVGGTRLATRAHFLSGSGAAIERISRAVGLRVSFDAEHKQFAHPTGLLLVDAQGTIRRYLNPMAITPFDVRLALAAADGGRIGSLADGIALLCYGWDAATGIYTLQIRRVLALASAATTLIIAVGLIIGFRRERGRAASAGTPAPRPAREGGA